MKPPVAAISCHIPCIEFLVSPSHYQSPRPVSLITLSNSQHTPLPPSQAFASSVKGHAMPTLPPQDPSRTPFENVLSPCGGPLSPALSAVPCSAPCVCCWAAWASHARLPQLCRCCTAPLTCPSVSSRFGYVCFTSCITRPVYLPGCSCEWCFRLASISLLIYGQPGFAALTLWRRIGVLQHQPLQQLSVQHSQKAIPHRMYSCRLKEQTTGARSSCDAARLAGCRTWFPCISPACCPRAACPALVSVRMVPASPAAASGTRSIPTSLVST